MYLELTDEQEFLAEAASGTLARRDTLAAARESLDGASPLELWGVAQEAGWTGLLSAEQVDGAELGAYDAILVLEACGSRLADAHLLGHLPAVTLIEAADHDDLELRRQLAAGEKRAALIELIGCEQPGGASAAPTVLLNGAAELVLDADGADVFVVVGDSWGALVEASAPGVTVKPQPAYDATRALATVNFDSVAGRQLGLTQEIHCGRDLQRALLAAESVGAAEACLTMARDYAIERRAFGRTIGSYQAIKHKIVEMMRRLENGRSLLVQAGRAYHQDAAEFALHANAALVIASDALSFAAAENIFIHGGIGATWEHDAQLYYRRAEVSRRLAGGVDRAAETVAETLLNTAATRG